MTSIINKKFLMIVSSIIVTAFLFLWVVGAVWGSVTFKVPTETPNTYTNFSFFSATTTNATSTNTTDGGQYFVISGAKKVTMYFTHGGVATTSTGGAQFRIQTTKEGSVWQDFNKLIGPDVSNTATSTWSIYGATSTAAVALDLSDDTFYAIRCISIEGSLAAPQNAIDGEQTCT